MNVRRNTLAVGVLLGAVAACGGTVGTIDGTAASTATSTATGDGGTSASGTCTSGVTWTRGNHGSPSMHPGRACISCHQTQPDAPRFTIAGTVFPGLHEADDCNGAKGTNLEVVITDADGASQTLAVNPVGNFYSTKSVAFPIHAKIVDTATGAENAMTDAQTTGNCNGCHTVDGASSAPGRITAP